MGKMTKMIVKSLTTKIAPMVYIMMFVSVFVGFCFATGFLVGGGESVMFRSGTLISTTLWGCLLLVTATAAEIGFFTKRYKLISFGGLGGFMVWLLAAIDLAISSHPYALVSFALFHMVFHGYVYLAASLGVLQRESIYRTSFDDD